MSAAWRVIVIRAWRDGASVRVRILSAGGPERQWTGTGSLAAEVVRRVVAELDGEPDDDPGEPDADPDADPGADHG
jgi:hypothetical protein